MTREEAIERFENVKANALVQKASGVSEYWQNEIDGTVEAIDMAIEALNNSIQMSNIQQLEDVVYCKDCIRNNDGNYCDIAFFINDDGDGFCNCGERREE